jgi:3-dehydroquinate dehydratase-2
MKILLINGPNLNILGQRETAMYGLETLNDVVTNLKKRALLLTIDLDHFQSNSEGDLIEFIQGNSDHSDAIIINSGALTHYGFALKDALVDARTPVVEVHISNIHARELYRRDSVISPIALGTIIGLGTQGYGYALEFLYNYLKVN